MPGPFDRASPFAEPAAPSRGHVLLGGNAEWSGMDALQWMAQEYDTPGVPPDRHLFTSGVVSFEEWWVLQNGTA